MTIQAFADGDFWAVFRSVFGEVMPMTFVVGGVFSLMLMSIYVSSRSVVMTAITAMLSGGVIVEFLPPEVRIAGFMLIFAGVAAAGSSIYLGRRRRITT